jgi:hypothetical protein
MDTDRSDEGQFSTPRANARAAGYSSASDNEGEGARGYSSARSFTSDTEYITPRGGNVTPMGSDSEMEGFYSGREAYSGREGEYGAQGGHNRSVQMPFVAGGHVPHAQESYGYKSAEGGPPYGHYQQQQPPHPVQYPPQQHQGHPGYAYQQPPPSHPQGAYAGPQHAPPYGGGYPPSRGAPQQHYQQPHYGGGAPPNPHHQQPPSSNGYYGPSPSYGGHPLDPQHYHQQPRAAAPRGSHHYHGGPGYHPQPRPAAHHRPHPQAQHQQPPGQYYPNGGGGVHHQPAQPYPRGQPRPRQDGYQSAGSDYGTKYGEPVAGLQYAAHEGHAYHSEVHPSAQGQQQHAYHDGSDHGGHPPPVYHGEPSPGAAKGRKRVESGGSSISTVGPGSSLLTATPSEEDIQGVISAARHGRVPEVSAYLDHGIPVNIRDKFGNTILAIACQNGLKKMAKLALRRGADINARNYKGNTPLHFCFTYGYGDTLGQYLISKGADPAVKNHQGSTCYEGLGGDGNSTKK